MIICLYSFFGGFKVPLSGNQSNEKRGVPLSELGCWAIPRLPYGTFLPSSATEMMVFSVSEGSEYRGACAATAVSDFAPPSQIPQALWFQDSDSAAGLVGGDLIILQSRNHSGLEAYHVYWGANSTHRLPGVAMVAAVPATTAGTNVTVTIASGTSLPVNATTLLVFASSSSGESRGALSIRLGLDTNLESGVVQRTSGESGVSSRI